MSESISNGKYHSILRCSRHQEDKERSESMKPSLLNEVNEIRAIDTRLRQIDRRVRVLQKRKLEIEGEGA
jgi:hypothetical protein